MRLEKRPSGGHIYAVVVEDVPNVEAPGWFRKKVVRSFGRWSKESEAEAMRWMGIEEIRRVAERLGLQPGEIAYELGRHGKAHMGALR